MKKLRYLEAAIRSDLRSGKMAWIGGPRQVGKTTLALRLLRAENQEHPAYLNWDHLADRDLIRAGKVPVDHPLVALDEIHKFARWRGLLKGLWDKFHHRTNFIVTGSARLDLFSRGGDSLLGRYHYFRLHPFSLREMSSRPTRADLERLLRFGGFPDPLFTADENLWRRWQRERLHRVIAEDLRDLDRVREISLLELLLGALPPRVGSPLSLKSLAEDLEVSQPSIKRWVELFDKLYLTYRISPFGAPRIRAVKKEQKLYFWDWSQCETPGARFENLVASQLLKYCHLEEDTRGYAMELRYLRDFDRREIDFVVLRDKKPIFAVECKNGEKALSPHIRYFRERTKIPAFYQVHLGEKDYGAPETTGRCLPFVKFCNELQMP